MFVFHSFCESQNTFQDRCIGMDIDKILLINLILYRFLYQFLL